MSSTPHMQATANTCGNPPIRRVSTKRAEDFEQRLYTEFKQSLTRLSALAETLRGGGAPGWLYRGKRWGEPSPYLAYTFPYTSPIMFPPDAIYQRYGRGGSKVRLLYVLHRSAKIRKRFRFYEDAERITRSVSPKLFSKNFSQAIRTARR